MPDSGMSHPVHFFRLGKVVTPRADATVHRLRAAQVLYLFASTRSINSIPKVHLKNRWQEADEYPLNRKAFDGMVERAKGALQWNSDRPTSVI